MNCSHTGCLPEGPCRAGGHAEVVVLPAVPVTFGPAPAQPVIEYTSDLSAAFRAMKAALREEREAHDRTAEALRWLLERAARAPRAGGARAGARAALAAHEEARRG